MPKSNKRVRPDERRPEASPGPFRYHRWSDPYGAMVMVRTAVTGALTPVSVSLVSEPVAGSCPGPRPRCRTSGLPLFVLSCLYYAFAVRAGIRKSAPSAAGIQPCAIATTAARVRSGSESLRSTLHMWFFTVCSLIPSRSPISRLRIPCETSSSTCNSRCVRIVPTGTAASA